MVATSFWGPDGKPLSLSEFIERLYGDITTLLGSEEELRELWRRPDTRRGLMEGLLEKGYTKEQIADVSRLINADKSDLFDVLAYIAYATQPITRETRVRERRPLISSGFSGVQRDFVDFVLDNYVANGVGELDDRKLPHLLTLRYHSIQDAVTDLGPVADIRKLFIGFQHMLY